MPISLFPYEVLLLVAENVVLVERRKEQAARDTLMALTTLTAITASWRNLIIGYSPLWRDIHIKIPPPRDIRPHIPTRIHPNDLERVTCFLQRSNRSPIHLHIVRSWPELPMPIEETLELEREWKLMDEILLPHMHRCRFISAALEHVGSAVEPLRLLRLCETPHLKELELVHRRPSYTTSQMVMYESPLGDDWNILPEIVPLQSLIFSDPMGYLPKVIDVSWPSLSTLDVHIHVKWWPKLCVTLSQLPTLRELFLVLISRRVESFNQGGDRVDSRDNRVQMPCVDRITTNNLAIWHDISTPILSSLSITATGPYSMLLGPTLTTDRTLEGLLPALIELPVREVIFTGCFLSPYALPALRSLASVESLRFNRSISNWKVLEPLAQERESSDKSTSPPTSVIGKGEILPALKIISIDESHRSFPAVADSSKTKSLVKRLRSLSLDVAWTLESFSTVNRQYSHLRAVLHS
ncbi:hypothetical protein DL93DRAFT_2228078 [Clavulina sp. PMI_390]|nr:hypothetical protein DL93DRAFT_2228078 [Clavulina sp. PMI_390]